MSRRPMPTEFGFTTTAYIPPARPRTVWRTFLFSALLFLIPVVGPGISAVYVDRRNDPERFSVTQALVTSLIQLVAVAVLAIILWVFVFAVLGVSIELDPRVTGPAA